MNNNRQKFSTQSGRMFSLPIEESRPLPPRRDDNMFYALYNSPLLPSQYKKILSANSSISIDIVYSGGFKCLAVLLKQLSIINKPVQLQLRNIIVDNSIYLPFHLLGDNVRITFRDDPEFESNFNQYIINNDEVLNSISNNLPPECSKRLLREKEIQNIFIDSFISVGKKNGHIVSDYSKDTLMDLIFKYVCSNYPYDYSIVGPRGEFTIESLKGSTAQKTFDRGKGICSGRSKLIKLLANNSAFNLPCYIVSGQYGSLGHMWNEYINEKGEIIEYDASRGLKVIYSRLPKIYKIENHEPDVKNVIRKRID